MLPYPLPRHPPPNPTQANVEKISKLRAAEPKLGSPGSGTGSSVRGAGTSACSTPKARPSDARRHSKTLLTAQVLGQDGSGLLLGTRGSPNVHSPLGSPLAPAGSPRAGRGLRRASVADLRGSSSLGPASLLGPGAIPGWLQAGSSSGHALLRMASGDRTLFDDTAAPLFTSTAANTTTSMAGLAFAAPADPYTSGAVAVGVLPRPSVGSSQATTNAGGRQSSGGGPTPAVLLQHAGTIRHRADALQVLQAVKEQLQAKFSDAVAEQEQAQAQARSRGNSHSSLYKLDANAVVYPAVASPRPWSGEPKPLTGSWLKAGLSASDASLGAAHPAAAALGGGPRELGSSSVWGTGAPLDAPRNSSERKDFQRRVSAWLERRCSSLTDQEASSGSLSPSAAQGETGEGQAAIERALQLLPFRLRRRPHSSNTTHVSSLLGLGLGPGGRRPNRSVYLRSATAECSHPAPAPTTSGPLRLQTSGGRGDGGQFKRTLTDSLLESSPLRKVAHSDGGDAATAARHTQPRGLEQPQALPEGLVLGYSHTGSSAGRAGAGAANDEAAWRPEDRQLSPHVSEEGRGAGGVGGGTAAASPDFMLPHHLLRGKGSSRRSSLDRPPRPPERGSGSGSGSGSGHGQGQGWEAAPSGLGRLRLLSSGSVGGSTSGLNSRTASHSQAPGVDAALSALQGGWAMPESPTRSSGASGAAARLSHGARPLSAGACSPTGQHSPSRLSSSGHNGTQQPQPLPLRSQPPAGPPHAEGGGYMDMPPHLLRHRDNTGSPLSRKLI